MVLVKKIVAHCVGVGLLLRNLSMRGERKRAHLFLSPSWVVEPATRVFPVGEEMKRKKRENRWKWRGRTRRRKTEKKKEGMFHSVVCSRRWTSLQPEEPLAFYQRIEMQRVDNRHRTSHCGKQLRTTKRGKKASDRRPNVGVTTFDFILNKRKETERFFRKIEPKKWTMKTKENDLFYLFVLSFRFNRSRQSSLDIVCLLLL